MIGQGVRVLQLTPELPVLEGGGGVGREYAFLAGLAERGHAVLNISPVTPAESERADSLRDAGVENWTVERRSPRTAEALHALAADPRILGTAVRGPLRALMMEVYWQTISEQVQRAVRDWRPDVVVIVQDMAAGWVTRLPRGLPAVLTLHDLTWRRYASEARYASAAKRTLLGLEARRHRRHTVGLLPRFAAAITVSTIETDELRASTSIPIELIPTGVDTQKITAAPEPAGPPHLLFTGTLNYSPNSDGIRWFVEEVWPLVRRERPDVTLDIVGRNPTPAVLELDRHAGVTVVGPVPAMGPEFARATAIVVPIRTGAGMRMKIVEAMSAGRPIVSTSLGCEGLPAIAAGEHLLVADDPAGFARETLRLLSDRELRARLGSAGRRTAVEAFDWRALADRYAAVLERAVAR
jgi:glycosyltransferase involved in cell wall biosynthesis